MYGISEYYIFTYKYKFFKKVLRLFLLFNLYIKSGRVRAEFSRVLPRCVFRVRVNISRVRACCTPGKEEGVKRDDDTW